MFEILSIHDLTRRSTIEDRIKQLTDFFQFTTSQGGRPEETAFLSKEIILSIHDLTRRSTEDHGIRGYLPRLSIHDLTRRSTVLVNVF